MLLFVQEELKRLEKELELDSTSRALYRLESQLSAIRGEGEQEGEGGNTSSLLLQASHIHDVSVDECSSSNNSNSCSPTPKKVLLVTPLKRGPSASSTPSRGGGSIGEELQEIVAGGGLPSPLCEKGEPKVPLLTELTRWQEAVRRAIIEEVEPAVSGRLMSALNRAMETIRRELVVRLQQTGAEEEEEQLRVEVEELRAQLAAEREERQREARRLDDVDMVEARLAEMAALLQVS